MPKRQDDVLNDVLVDKIIEVIQNDPKITQVELVKILNIPYRSLQRKMDEMKDSGVGGCGRFLGDNHAAIPWR